MTAAELKALLEPLLDFGLKSGEQAYADTLPAPIKKAIDEHQILVGMNKRMVLAAMGQPESKLRERAADSATGEVFEEWVYGHTPQTIRFVRFRGDRVILLKTAALGKSIAVLDKDELAGYRDPSTLHTVALGDGAAAGGDGSKGPSLKAPGEALPEERRQMGSGPVLTREAKAIAGSAAAAANATVSRLATGDAAASTAASCAESVERCSRLKGLRDRAATSSAWPLETTAGCRTTRESRHHTGVQDAPQRGSTQWQRSPRPVTARRSWTPPPAPTAPSAASPHVSPSA